jgi:SNF2 family DNA or RNA helicase
MPTNKPAYIKRLVDSWPDESTIIWCHYNDEQESMERTFPDAVSISGATSQSDREIGIDRFKAGDARILISKPKVLGFGLNLQIATRQVFSGLKDSYEEFYQAVKRSNRIGSTRPLNVHIPVTELEMAFVDNVLRKSDRVEADTKEQEELFKEIGHACFVK